MPKQNLKIAPPLSPLSAISIEKTALFSCTENTGIIIGDKFNNYTDVSMTGTTANPLSTNPGWVTLNGTDSYFNLPIGLWPSLASVGVFTFGGRFYRAADNGAAETILDVGSGSATKGLFRIQMLGTGAIQVSTRGIGASAATQPVLAGFDMTTYNAVANGVSLLFVLRGMSGLTCSLDLYVDGVFTSTTALDFSTNGGIGYPTASVAGDLRFGTTVGTPVAFIGGGTASAKQSGLFFHNSTTYDAVKIAALALERYRLPYEKSRALA